MDATPSPHVSNENGDTSVAVDDIKRLKFCDKKCEIVEFCNDCEKLLLQKGIRSINIISPRLPDKTSNIGEVNIGEVNIGSEH